MILDDSRIMFFLCPIYVLTGPGDPMGSATGEGHILTSYLVLSS